MTLNDFIFSDQPRQKFLRHFAFWLIFSLHFIVQNLMIGGPGEGKTSRTFLQSGSHFLYFFPVYLLSTYFFIEVLLPEFLFKGRYAAFAFSSLLHYAVSFIAIYYAGLLYLDLLSTGTPFSNKNINANKYHALVDGFFILFMLFAITAGFKFSKKWYLQQRENERLAKQKLATELQLLKTSIHPRFLLHSLKTVNRHVNNLSDLSPALIVQLFDLLSYILYEKDEEWVPLEKELEIIKYYINLEEKGFEGKLGCNTKFPQHARDQLVVPLVLLSFIECSFEYFYETMQDRPSVNLVIDVNDGLLHFTLLFSISERIIFRDWVEAKLVPLKKQLNNQYKGLHQLRIDEKNDCYLIELKLPLYSTDLINTNKELFVHEVPGLV